MWGRGTPTSTVKSPADRQTDLRTHCHRPWVPLFKEHPELTLPSCPRLPWPEAPAAWHRLGGHSRTLPGQHSGIQVCLQPRAPGVPDVEKQTPRGHPVTRAAPPVPPRFPHTPLIPRAMGSLPRKTPHRGAPGSDGRGGTAGDQPSLPACPPDPRPCVLQPSCPGCPHPPPHTGTEPVREDAKGSTGRIPHGPVSTGHPAGRASSTRDPEAEVGAFSPSDAYQAASLIQGPPGQAPGQGHLPRNIPTPFQDKE